MVVQRISPVFLVLCFFWATQSAVSGVIVSEAMVNEPGSNPAYEWIEIYNNSPDPVPLPEVTIIHAGDTITLPGAPAIQPEQFVVVVRNRYSFESIWGNRSGNWGDAPAENFWIFSKTFSLPNRADSIIVMSQGERSVFSYPDGGADGVSWERVFPDSSLALPSTDPKKSSPGRVNAVSPPLNNLRARLLDARPEHNGRTMITFVVENNGQRPTIANSLNIYANPVIDSATWTIASGDFLKRVPFSALEPGGADTLTLSAELAGIYAPVGASLSHNDDRLWDNVTDTLVPGSSYPPLILNEFLPDPESPFTTEWVEIKNSSNTVIGLDGWRLGDELALTTIAGTNVKLFSHGRAIFTPDTAQFLAENPRSNADLIEVRPWRALNNTGDLVRLVDSLGFTADSLRYDAGWGGNITWARDESSDEYFPAIWGRSTEVGGSPGLFNYILASASAETITLTVTPNPFSPDGDGFEDEVVFALASPPGERLTAQIYNRDGSVIRTLTNTTPFSGDITWDGKTDNGRRVPVGIYIVYVSVDGVYEFKSTVTVAR